MPFGNTRVIPTGWSRHHAPVAEGGMNAEVTIGTRGATTHDPDTDETTTTWSQEYAGPARIQALNEAQQQDLAGERISGRGFLVQIRFDADRVVPGMRVHVTSAVNDELLVGDDLWLVDAQSGSERFTRDLICSDNQSDVPQEP